MIVPAVSIARYLGQYDLLDRLASFLQRSRAGRYADLIGQGHLSASDAHIDEAARAAIAADWRAIAGDVDRDASPDAPTRWKIWTLGEAVRVMDLHIERLTIAEADDHIDLRDATACLLHYQRSPTGGPLYWRAERRARAAA